MFQAGNKHDLPRGPSYSILIWGTISPLGLPFLLAQTTTFDWNDLFRPKTYLVSKSCLSHEAFF